jgi:hypothetical protein
MTTNPALHELQVLAGGRTWEHDFKVRYTRHAAR